MVGTTFSVTPRLGKRCLDWEKEDDLDFVEGDKNALNFRMHSCSSGCDFIMTMVVYINPKLKQPAVNRRKNFATGQLDLRDNDAFCKR
jgi:hypothetical protein